ncbi:MAG TPA: hypothetical protein VGN59_11600 [Acidimicrobiia bacterium]
MAAPDVTRVSARRVLRDVGQSYRHRFGRVVIAAALVFGITAVVGAAVEDLTHRAEPNFVIYVIALTGTAMSQVGITFYAGLLDKVVGEFELGEDPEPVLHVLRTLPYGSLIVADILITVVSAVGLVLLVIPGVVAFTLFAITGPVINIEHLGALRGMRRSAELVRHHFWLVLLLVAVPIAIEHQVIELANELVLHHSLVEVFLVQGLLGMIVGSFVGLVEVNVAYGLELERVEPAPPA